MSNYEDVKTALLKFREERDWNQFHDPKNLAEAISIEAGELLEVFLWKTKEEATNLNNKDKESVREEVADIFNFLVYLCIEQDIDIFEVSLKKIEDNRRKYPVTKSLGTAKKYKEL